MTEPSKFDAVILHIIRKLKTSVHDYCDLETIDGPSCIVAQDGSLASIIQFNGTKSVLGRDQYARLIQLMETSLAVYFGGRGHQIQVVFRRDLDARGTLDTIAVQQRMAAARVGLAVEDLIDENVEKYSAYVYDEDCWLVCWSLPVLLDPVEARMSRDAINEFRRESNWPPTANGQNLLRPIRQLRDRHLAFVSKVCDDLGQPEFGCSAELLDVGQALRNVRYSVNPDITPPNWRPSVPGTRIPFRWKANEHPEDLSEILYPALPEQIMVTTAESGGGKHSVLSDSCTIRVGARAYAPLVVAIPPREPEYFNDLFHALNRAETTERGKTRAVPYSISFMLEGDGMSVMTLKSIFASLLAFTSEINRNITLAAKELAEYRRDGGKIVKLRISAMTWSGIEKDEIKELTLRKSKLWRALEGWGNPVVAERTGNPMESFQSNCVGLTTRHIGNPCPAPLGEAIKLLPLTRPASPFSQGSTIYRSLDGKILRYQRFSSEQTTWITLISGKPGSGKSVLMNSNNFESCFMPGALRLPYICIIDIGVSSSGFIDLVRDSLPPEKQHEAIYKRIQNSANDAINPLDTSLGCREPLPRDREFIKNFVTILVTPPERKGTAHEGMSTFVGRIIDLTYKRKSDHYEKAQAETYKPGHDTVVDEAVARLTEFRVMPATTYWQIVDALFTAGMQYEAEIAQRYAVPILNHLVETAASEEIRAEYGAMNIASGMSIIDAFNVGIREAVGDFPIFSSYTQFDIGSSRVMALDLQDVALIGSDAASKQTSLMYMIARQSFMKKVAYSKEDLQFFDKRYKAYFERLVADITDEYKVLCMDELHKTGGNKGLEGQLMTDGREARKWNLEIVLASQLMSDFGDLTKIATSYFMMDSGTEQTRAWLRDNIGLSDVEERALTNHVHGAGRHGATFLARFVTKSATFTQLFTMTAGPMRLWALSTTAEDRRLRNMLYAQMPKPVARRLLAEQFPSGSCKAMVERIKNEEMRQGTFVDDDVEASVVERIGKSLIEAYYKSSLSDAA